MGKMLVTSSSQALCSLNVLFVSDLLSTSVACEQVAPY